VHRAHHFDAVGLVDAVVNFLPALLAYQQFRIAQDLQVMRDGRAADLEQARDVVDADFLTGLENQQDLLAGGIAQRGKEAENRSQLSGRLSANSGFMQCGTRAFRNQTVNQTKFSIAQPENMSIYSNTMNY
jgi:hypothetical protein